MIDLLGSSEYELIDISPQIDESLAVWPGDRSFSREIMLDMKKGDNLTLSSMTSTLHLGAHADGPNHYSENAEGIGERNLSYYFGKCQVLKVSTKKGERIKVADLENEIHSKRVLFKTGSYPDPKVFNEDFCSLSPELVKHLAKRGVITVGIDTPSVDLFDDKVLLSHNEIAKNDMAVLEGLVLSDAAPGNYIISAFPLKLNNCDAAPLRAVLIDLNAGNKK